MRNVVIDENCPRSFGRVFADHEFGVIDIRDYGLCGASDSAVFDFVKGHRSALVTSDVEFAQRVHWLENKHYGVILIRLPSFLSIAVRCQEIDRALKELSDRSIENHIVVITPGQVRVHGKAT